MPHVKAPDFVMAHVDRETWGALLPHLAAWSEAHGLDSEVESPEEARVIREPRAK